MAMNRNVCILIVLFALPVASALAQSPERSPARDQVQAQERVQQPQQERRDNNGSQPIDPTKNVLDLVREAIKRQDDLREMESRFQTALRESEVKFQKSISDFEKSMRDAETRRINELASQKQLFDLELARVLRANVDSAALLLSTQLKEVKTDLSDRTAKLEQFRWETGGKSAGMSDILGWLVAAVMGVIALGGLVTNMRRQAAVAPVVVNGNRKP